MEKVNRDVLIVPAGKFFCYSRQNTGAGYWPERPDFANCNFPNFFLCKYLRVNVTNFQSGREIAKKTKNLKKIHKIIFGELSLKIYILLRSDYYFGRSEVNMVFQLSGPVFRRMILYTAETSFENQRPFLRNSK